MATYAKRPCMQKVGHTQKSRCGTAGELSSLSRFTGTRGSRARCAMALHLDRQTLIRQRDPEAPPHSIPCWSLDLRFIRNGRRRKREQRSKLVRGLPHLCASGPGGICELLGRQSWLSSKAVDVQRPKCNRKRESQRKEAEMKEGRSHGLHPLTAAKRRHPSKRVDLSPHHAVFKPAVRSQHTKAQRHTPTMKLCPKRR